MKILNLFIIFILLFYPLNAFAGDIMKAGTVLKEDSYVFTIQQAQELKLRIEELEFIEKNQLEIINHYKALDLITQEKYESYSNLIDVKKEQILEYEHIIEINDDRIKTLEKQQKISALERWGFFGAGIGFAIGAILIADKIDDVAELQ